MSALYRARRKWAMAEGERVSAAMAHHRIERRLDTDAVVKELGIELDRAMLDSDVSGMLVRVGHRAAIVVNAEHHHRRQTFSVAHELGHYYLHDAARSFISKVYRRDSVSSKGIDPEEIEANHFAAALLMPASAMPDRVHPGNVTSLAHEFGVSAEACSNRARTLGRWTDDDPEDSDPYAYPF